MCVYMHTYRVECRYACAVNVCMYVYICAHLRSWVSSKGSDDLLIVLIHVSMYMVIHVYVNIFLCIIFMF